MGLLGFVMLFRFTTAQPVLEIDFTLDEPRGDQTIELPVELRDNTAQNEWSRAEDYELAATLGRLTIACNNHFIVRNIAEAQVVASYSIQW